MQEAEKCVEEAANIFKKYKNKKAKEKEKGIKKALNKFALGLHAIQDYYAHGDFFPFSGKWDPNYQRFFTNILIHDQEYDNPFYDWKNKKVRNSFGQILAKPGSRYHATQNATKLYWYSFELLIGEKDSKYFLR